MALVLSGMHNLTAEVCESAAQCVRLRCSPSADVDYFSVSRYAMCDTQHHILTTPKSAEHTACVFSRRLLAMRSCLAACMVSACRYCLGAAVTAVEQSVLNHMVRVLCTLPQGPQLPGGARDRLTASIAVAATAISRSCDLLAATFLPAASAATSATRDLPDLVQAELQRLLLSLKSKLFGLACGPPDGASDTMLCTRSGLGFKGRNFVSLQHNPLFPQSPTGRTSGDSSLRASLGRSGLSQDVASDMLSAPEPYHCRSDVAVPTPAPPLMCLVVYSVCEVCWTAAPSRAPPVAMGALQAC